MITARFLHAEFFEYRPQFKIIMSGNHKPEIRGTDRGMWRRVCLVPFTVTIQEDEKDVIAGPILRRVPVEKCGTSMVDYPT